MHVSFMRFSVLCVSLTLFGCASTGQYQAPDTPERKQALETLRKSLPLNPRHGEVIWGHIKVGMSVDEVMQAVKGSKFDDQWSSGGAVGAMAEAGIVAANKVKVTAEIKGPFQTSSILYVLFDEAERCDGVVIGTLKRDLPESVLKNYGTIGFYLAEFKEAAKAIIKFGIPELGSRSGPPRLGRDPMDSLSVGVGVAVTPRAGVGVGIPTSISPATITQNYERKGFRTLLSIRALYLGLYNVYSAPIVFMSIQARPADDTIEDVQ